MIIINRLNIIYLIKTKNKINLFLIIVLLFVMLTIRLVFLNYLCVLRIVRIQSDSNTQLYIIQINNKINSVQYMLVGFKF